MTQPTGKPIAGHIEQWRSDLPKVQMLAPYGKARTNARFRLMPTHPDSERLSQAFYAWALRTGIFPPETAGILNRTQMGYLVYWHAPFSSDKARWLMGTFHLWVTAVDDFFVERGLPLDELALACDDAIRHGRPESSSNPYVQFFIEHRNDIIAEQSAGLLGQIADQVKRYFQDWKQEQIYLRDRCLPGLMEYLRLRVGITALYGQMHSQRIDKGLVPSDQSFGTRLDKLAQLVNVVESLNGDIIGIQKDIEDGYPINVIPVLALEFGVDLPTAYLMAVELLDLYKSIVDALVADISARPGRAPEAAAQAQTLALWLDGFHTWHSRGARHGTARAPDAALLPRLPDGDFATLVGALAKASGPLGTSAWRVTASPKSAEQLRAWAKNMLGWSTPTATAAPKPVASAPEPIATSLGSMPHAKLATPEPSEAAPVVARLAVAPPLLALLRSAPVAAPQAAAAEHSPARLAMAPEVLSSLRGTPAAPPDEPASDATPLTAALPTTFQGLGTSAARLLPLLAGEARSP